MLFLEAILPPQSAAPVVSVQPYHFLFVGGVPRVALERYPRSGKSETVLERYLQSEVPLDRYPRANKPRRRERIAYYVTDIPALLGCFRGFMLGEQLDLKRGGSRPLDPGKSISLRVQVGYLKTGPATSFWKFFCRNKLISNFQMLFKSAV